MNESTESDELQEGYCSSIKDRGSVSLKSMMEQIPRKQHLYNAMGFIDSQRHNPNFFFFDFGVIPLNLGAF